MHGQRTLLKSYEEAYFYAVFQGEVLGHISSYDVTIAESSHCAGGRTCGTTQRSPWHVNIVVVKVS